MPVPGRRRRQSGVESWRVLAKTPITQKHQTRMTQNRRSQIQRCLGRRHRSSKQHQYGLFSAKTQLTQKKMGGTFSAGFSARILGDGHRSSFGRSTSIASIESVRHASRVDARPLPCTPPRTPSGRRGRHSGGRPCPPCLRPLVLSGLPTETCSPLPAASSRWNVNSGSAGRGTSSPSATSIRPAVHPAKIAAASCRRRVIARLRSCCSSRRLTLS